MSLSHQFAYPDAHYLAAAEGWLELGDHREAARELKGVSRALRCHPEVLLVRWQVCARAKAWTPCLTAARTFTKTAPADSRGWILLAQTYYLCGRVAKAYQTAVLRANSFPDDWPLLYDVARYACRLGKRREAQRYLRLAMAAGDTKSLKRKALEDPDLEDLWVRPSSPGGSHKKEGRKGSGRAPAPA